MIYSDNDDSNIYFIVVPVICENIQTYIICLQKYYQGIKHK